jgi:hypothetical protein
VNLVFDPKSLFNRLCPPESAVALFLDSVDDDAALLVGHARYVAGNLLDLVILVLLVVSDKRAQALEFECQGLRRPDVRLETIASPVSMRVNHRPNARQSNRISDKSSSRNPCARTIRPDYVLDRYVHG